MQFTVATTVGSEWEMPKWRDVLPPLAAAVAIGAVIWAVSASWSVSGLRQEIHALGANLSARIDTVTNGLAELTRRVGAIDNRLRKVEISVAKIETKLEPRVTSLEGTRPTDEQVKRYVANLERNITRTIRRNNALDEVALLQSRILPVLTPSDMTVVGTIIVKVAGEKVLTIEDRESRRLTFSIAPDAFAKAYCGGGEQDIGVADIKPGTAVLVAYRPQSPHKNVAKIIVKSECT